MKECIRGTILFLVFMVIIILNAYLFGNNPNSMWYAIFLCAFIGVFYLVIRFIQWRQRMKQLDIVESSRKNSLEELPVPGDNLERKYQELLRKSDDDRRRVLSERKRRESETSNYYTLWIHQIKTPIAALRLLLQSEENAERKRKMEQELIRTEQYAEMALHYLRLQGDATDLLLKDYEISSLVKEALRKFSNYFIEKKLFLQFEDFSYHTVTDEKWMVFIFEQLISNAVKYTNRGGLQIQFVEDPVPSVVIQDTGIGIKEEDLPRIFEKGYTGYNGHMDKKSTGIGLYLCKQVADRLGIELLVESELGKGTTVKIKLLDMIQENRSPEQI